MPRRNRPPQHRRPQHARGKARPAGMHKKHRSEGIADATRWLDEVRRIEGEAA